MQQNGLHDFCMHGYVILTMTYCRFCEEVECRDVAISSSNRWDVCHTWWYVMHPTSFDQNKIIKLF